MKKILFVCHGNICRSPMAEFMMKKAVKDAGLESEFEIASAATSREEIGNDIYPPAKETLRRHGVPFTSRAARQMTRADYDRYNHIFLMDRGNARLLGRIMPDVFSGDGDGKVRLLMSLTGEERDVADPWYTGDFEKTYEDISEALSELLHLCRREAGMEGSRQDTT